MPRCKKKTKEAPPVDLVADVRASLERMAALHGEMKARQCQAVMQQVLAIQALVAEIRADGVQEMRDTGQTLKDVGEALGLSITRVKQMEKRVGRRAQEE